MKGKIAVGPGDGIGPEIVAEGVKVLEAVSEKYGHEFVLTYVDIGGVAIDKYGEPFPAETAKLCRESDAILLGAAGGPKWEYPKVKVDANTGLLALRKEFGLFANLRPVKVFPGMVNCSPFKRDAVRGVDLIVLRENTGGLYFGQPKKRWRTDEGRMAVDSMVYSEKEIERLLRVGFELAQSRRKKLCSVDKANVLQTGQLWREIANELAPEYPDVELTHAYVDACAMWLLRQPRDFDVIAMGNIFGDIISDEASVLAGSLGMLPSAQLTGSGLVGTTFGFYESSHGSAPKHTGKNDVNPIATILSVAMMLRYTYGLKEETKCIEQAVEQALQNYRTYDVMEAGKTKVGTREMGDLIAGAIVTK
ncbi:3-isopropylmalate dehydrogenase [subsurface metagenome]